MRSSPFSMCGVVVVGLSIKTEVSFVLVLFYICVNIFFLLGEMVGNNGFIWRIKLDFLVTSNSDII